MPSILPSSCTEYAEYNFLIENANFLLINLDQYYKYYICIIVSILLH